MLIIKTLWGSNRGQGLVEYGLILFFIAIAVILSLNLLGGGVNGLFLTVNAAWP